MPRAYPSNTGPIGSTPDRICLPTSPPPSMLLALFFALQLGLLLVTPASAQLTPSVKQTLLQEIERAKAKVSVEQFPSITEQTQKTLRAHSNLVRYLNSFADQENREGWLEYFDFEELLSLIESLNSGETEGRNTIVRNLLGESRAVYWRMTRNLPGLERSAVREMRDAVQDLENAVRLSNPDIAVKRLQELLSELADVIENSDTTISPEDFATVSFALPLIESSNVAPQVLRQLETYLGRPNVRVSVGKQVIQRAVTRPVYDSGPNSDCILGTRVLSQTQLGGQLNSILIPNPLAAQIQLVINANFNSRGTGYNSGVKILNRSYGPVRSYRDLYINDSGVSVGPVSATASLQTQILGIQHPLRIVRRIAAKKAAQQKSQANRIAESKLENRVSTQFEQQSSSQISQGNLLPRAAAVDVLNRFDFQQPRKHWSTNSEYLVLELDVANKDQVTTAVGPPAIVPGFDTVIQFHESAINNPATHLLAGRTLTDSEVRSFIAGLIPAGVGPEGFSLKQLLKTEDSLVEIGSQAIDEIAEQATGEELGLSQMTEDESQSLEITFALQQPLIFEARDGTLRLGINVRRITRNGETLQDPTAISAAFKPVRKSNGVVRLERVGEIDVRVLSSSKDKFNPLAAGIIARLRNRFDEIFPAFLLDRTLSANNEMLKKLSPDPLQIKAIKPRKGWLTIYAE